MGRLRTKAVHCQYKEYDRLLTEEFINGLNDDGMVDETLKEVATLEDTEDTIHVPVLLHVHRLEAYSAQ